MMRKPSCLISCSHWLPDGTFVVLVGRHGAMNPAGREQRLLQLHHSRRAFFASRVGAHRCYSEIAILRTKLSGKCGVGQLVMTRRTALCVVASGESGSYAIRALRDLCLGIVSKRLAAARLNLVTFKPRHVRGFSLLPPPALGEPRHRGLARRLVAVGRRAVFEVGIGQRPKPWCARGRGGGLEDAADYRAFTQHVVVVLAPFAGRARGWGALEREIVFVHVQPQCLSAMPRAAAAPSAKKTQPNTK